MEQLEEPWDQEFLKCTAILAYWNGAHGYRQPLILIQWGTLNIINLWATPVWTWIYMFYNAYACFVCHDWDKWLSFSGWSPFILPLDILNSATG